MLDSEDPISRQAAPTRPAVVLDKSFLRAASNRQLLGLFSQFEVVVPQSLIFEILTASSAEDRVFCAERLRFSGQEFRIVETTGTLLRFEIEHHKPCSPVLELVRSPKAELGARMAESPLTLRPGEDAGIQVWREDLGESVEAFLAESETIPRIFTDLANAKESTRKATATAMRAQVAADSSHVLKLYSGMTNPTYPPVDGLNEDWAFFRRLQVHFLAALDQFGSHGPGLAQKIRTEKSRHALENEVIDLDYRLIGVMVGGFATCDKDSAAAFQLLKPHGVLVERDWDPSSERFGGTA